MRICKLPLRSFIGKRASEWRRFCRVPKEERRKETAVRCEFASVEQALWNAEHCSAASALKTVMVSVSEKLRQERLQRNLDLAQIAEQTGIGRRFLEAIEAGQWDRLPGTFYAKSFVRQYARLLHVDVEIEPELESVFGAVECAPIPSQEPHFGDLHLPPISGQLRQAGLHRRVQFPLASLVGAVLLCLAGYAIFRGVRLTIESAAEPKNTASKISEFSSVRDQPPPDSRGVPVRGNELSLNLVARERTWVSLWVDSRCVFRDILNPSERRSFEGQRRMLLYTGNAGALEIQWNAEPISSIGRRGEVRVVEFTREGFQVHLNPYAVLPARTEER